MLSKFNFSFSSDLEYEKIRLLETHKLIGILNGNKLTYVKALNKRYFLFRTCICTGLKCFIYHKSQPSNKRTPYCTQCWEDSHFKKQCPNTPRCKMCKEDRHTSGNPAWKHFTEPVANLVPFSGEKIAYQISSHTTLPFLVTTIYRLNTFTNMWRRWEVVMYREHPQSSRLNRL